MSRIRSQILSWMMILAVCSFGCSAQKPAPVSGTGTKTDEKNDADGKPPAASDKAAEKKASDSPKAASDASQTSKLTPTDSPTSKAAPAEQKTASNSKASTPTSKAPPTKKASTPKQTSFPEASYLADDVVALVVANPKQFMSSPVGKMVTQLGAEEQAMPALDILKQLNLKIGDIERATIVFDQAFVSGMARQAGLQTGANPAVEAAVARNNQVNNMKMIGLAFHNYHDVFNAFPRADGDGPGQKTGLSWRVHLLPFLDQAPLYTQFNLDEPWDSDTNKALIEAMPAIFKTADVDDAGKTSVHVFVGEQTPFNGDQGKKISAFTDGTSNTILAVVAGADTAEIWTKPGGLEVDMAAPKKALGNLKDDKVLALIADGSVRELPTDNETQLANLIQPNDGQIVQVDAAMAGAPGSSMPAPTLIASLAKEVDQAESANAFLHQATKDEHEGQSFYKNESQALWFPNARTVVVGSVDSVKQAIATQKSGKSGSAELVQRLNVGADLTFAMDLESQSALIQQVVEQAAQFNPMIGMVSNIKSVAVQLSASGNEGDPMVELVLTTVSPEMAPGLAALMSMGVAQGKMLATQLIQSPNSDIDASAIELAKSVVNSAAVKTTDDRIQFLVPTPAGFERLPETLKPVLEKAKEAAAATQRMNNLKQIGLAFHNFESTFRAFPGAGRMTKDQPIGLSWRVYLLPYLDQAPLYNQFHFDEAWDSDHNKALIPLMPALFKTPGVDDPTKTSIHVFTGEGAPFADDATPGLREFTDGTSNTLLVVQAGPDTAEVWTKPGGLDYDPKDPIKALGKLTEDMFLILIADGSVRRVSKDIDADTLRNLIQHQDGQGVAPF